MINRAVDVDTLARTLYGEARGEGLDGQIAVCHVVFNRSRDRRWPDTWAKVSRQKWQFSCWNKNDPNSSKLELLQPEDQGYRDMTRAVLTAIETDDPTGGANHYFADYITPPKWAKDMTHTITIGRHLFYIG